MDIQWLKPENDPAYRHKRALAKDAYYAGCWIFSVKTGKWYTPEEFVKSNETVSVHRGKPDQADFKVMDPKAGIKQKLTKLSADQKELEEFTKKVCDYYDFKRKGK